MQVKYDSPESKMLGLRDPCMATTASHPRSCPSIQFHLGRDPLAYCPEVLIGTAIRCPPILFHLGRDPLAFSFEYSDGDPLSCS